MQTFFVFFFRSKEQKIVTFAVRIAPNNMNESSFTYFDTMNNTSYPGHQLKGKERYKKLYHFTSFDIFTRIWIAQELKYGSISNVNDIQESLKYYSVNSLSHLPVMCAYQDILSSYRQISFTMDIDSFLKGFMNTMMWGVYGDKTKGVCIEFDYDRIQFPKGTMTGIVKYKNFPLQHTVLPDNLKTLKQVKQYISKNLKQLFFQKQTIWKGENEFRVISNGDEYLNIENAITGVYLTTCMSKECQLVEELVKDAIPVKYLDFHQDNGVYLPCAYPTKTSREEIIGAQNDPNNALELFYKQAWKYYEEHKNDENVSLILNSYSLKP